MILGLKTVESKNHSITPLPVSSLQSSAVVVVVVVAYRIMHAFVLIGIFFAVLFFDCVNVLILALTLSSYRTNQCKCVSITAAAAAQEELDAEATIRGAGSSSHDDRIISSLRLFRPRFITAGGTTAGLPSMPSAKATTQTDTLVQKLAKAAKSALTAAAAASGFKAASLSASAGDSAARELMRPMPLVSTASAQIGRFDHHSFVA